MATKHFITFDLGATSGRTILATLSENRLDMKELNRFPNKIMRIGNRYCWNIYSLFESLKDGLKSAAALNVAIDSIGIDTWGVDFALLGEDNTILSLPRSYRDPYTNGIPEEYFKIIPCETVYDLTGIQIMNFNSIFQLYALSKENNSALKAARKLLFMPDALAFLLTGKQVMEYTIASTSQLINPRTRQIEPRLAEAAGISADLFASPVMPGTVIGTLHDHIARETGIREKIPVIAVAGHDTGSAVAAVPAEDENFAYLSSGTWSLMGIELKNPVINTITREKNFTNEGGAEGTVRFLKNITGMWLLEQCRKEWSAAGVTYTYSDIAELSTQATAFRSLIDPDAACFANPESMTEAIADFCRKTKQPVPEDHAGIIRCIFDSLALKYKYVFNSLQQTVPFRITKLHVIGGGSQNRLLNQFTASATGVTVAAGPSEATAAGNAMMQAKGLGAVASLHDIRKIIANSYVPEIFEPQDTECFEKEYGRFTELLY
ncbi:MAG: rhamnulokinase [Dysgonamonadaceae bacterium]|jgi:rhamnulokinase|nr:rhamnulokinase [Dysgonamonadaceae bacterium]